MTRPDVSIVIPCFNQVEYTVRCLTALAEHTPADRYEVVIVDNASSDGTAELCAQLEGDVVVIRNEANLGFAKACNQGAAAASGRHLLFLNNDTEALPGWLEPLLDTLDDEPEVGAVGSKLLYPDGTLQHAGILVREVEGVKALVPTHRCYRLAATHPAANQRDELDAVTAACVLIRRDAFEQAGGFDEGYWNGLEDVDLCFTLGENGWRIRYEPSSVLYHHESVSGPERFTRDAENLDRLQAKWAGRHWPALLQTSSGDIVPHPQRTPAEAGGR